MIQAIAENQLRTLCTILNQKAFIIFKFVLLFLAISGYSPVAFSSLTAVSMVVYGAKVGDYVAFAPTGQSCNFAYENRLLVTTGSVVEIPASGNGSVPAGSYLKWKSGHVIVLHYFDYIFSLLWCIYCKLRCRIF